MLVLHYPGILDGKAVARNTPHISVVGQHFLLSLLMPGLAKLQLLFNLCNRVVVKVRLFKGHKSLDYTARR